jgi:hypothetical protein
MIAWRMRSRRNIQSNDRQSMLSEDESLLLKSLKRACESEDSGQARRALGAWLNGFGPENSSGSLLDFAAGLDDEVLRASVYAMDSHGYRPDGNKNWNSRNFWKQFEAWKKSWKAAAAARKPPLTDLYAKENRL